MGVTKSAAGLTAASAAMAPLDPTGLSAMTFILSGTVTCTAGVFKTGKKGVKWLRGQPETSTSLTTTSQPEFTPDEEFLKNLRKTIFSLSSATVSSSASITMGVVMPPALAGLLFSAPVLVYKGRKLYKLKKEAGGMRALFGAISKLDVLAQITGGAALASLVLVLCVGPAEFNTMCQGLSAIAADPSVVFQDFKLPTDMAVGSEVADAMATHDDAVNDGLLHTTTTMADALPGVAKAALGVSGIPVLHDGTPFMDSMIIGTAAGASQMAAQLVVETPASEALSRLPPKKTV
ncbi:hypothetical protein DL768_004762 [Monosporascus sp. mg162]|nr:hypothetical protein DL768_004762 [Monosporascus sp. mg162]